MDYIELLKNREFEENLIFEYNNLWISVFVYIQKAYLKQFRDSDQEDDVDKNVKLWKRIENFNKKVIKEQEKNTEIFLETNKCSLNEIYMLFKKDDKKFQNKFEINNKYVTNETTYDITKNNFD